MLGFYGEDSFIFVVGIRNNSSLAEQIIVKLNLINFSDVRSLKIMNMSKANFSVFLVSAHTIIAGGEIESVLVDLLKIYNVLIFLSTLEWAVILIRIAHRSREIRFLLFH